MGDYSPVKKEKKNDKCRGVFTFKQPHILTKNCHFMVVKGYKGHQTEDRTEKRAARAKTGRFFFLPLSLLNLPDLTNRFTGFIKL